MARLSFFVGKGGVGKTTVSASYAAQAAARRPKEKILLVSTDPAHSLGAVFQQKVGKRAQRVRGAMGKLFAWQVDAEEQFHHFFEPYRDAVLKIIESGTIFSRKEIEPIIDSTLPGMAEISGLLALHELLAASEYDEIVVDTAPIGHTLRLFELPEHFSRFLDFLDVAGSRDEWLAARFGSRRGEAVSGLFLDEWRKIVGDIQSALQQENSHVVLVTSPEQFSLKEARRTMRQMEERTSLRVDAVVLNRVVRAAKGCRLCLARARMTRAALAALREDFAGVPHLLGEYNGSPVLGARKLRAFGEHVFHKKEAPAAASAPRASKARLIPAAWPELKTPLTFTVGKGGVGKTTVSASLAFHMRRSSKAKKAAPAITVCSTDPAPSLDDIFLADVSGEPRSVLGDTGLRAIEVDSVAEFQRWAGEMRGKVRAAFGTGTSGGVHVDMSFDREVFSALLDIVPPGVDEIFAIFKLMQLQEGAGKRGAAAKLVIDMAPTGHALELLRMPERMLTWSRLLLKSLAQHRSLPLAQDVAVEIASLSQRVRELLKRMADPAQSQLVAVTLAEPMPVGQTAALEKSLVEMGMACEAVFVNRVLMEANSCARCHRARAWQARSLQDVKKKWKKRALVLPNQEQEIAGREALERFTREEGIFAIS